MRVLAINGVLDQVKSLRGELGSGHEVWWSPNGGRVAEHLFRGFKPHAVVMFLNDLNPDHKKSIVIFRHPKGRDACAVVVVAPFTHLKLVQQVLDWGVDAYLASPCGMDRVKRRLEDLLSGWEVAERKDPVKLI